MCYSSLIYTISTCSLWPFSPHQFYFLAASAACFTVSFQFFFSFSISHSLPVINMHVFHNPHHEMYRNVTYPAHLNPNSMTCWQNSAIIQQESTGSSTVGSYPAEELCTTHVLFSCCNRMPLALPTFQSPCLLLFLCLLLHIFLVYSSEIIVGQDVNQAMSKLAKISQNRACIISEIQSSARELLRNIIQCFWHACVSGSCLKQALRTRGYYLAKTSVNMLENVLDFTARLQIVLSNIYLLLTLKDVKQ